MALLNNVTTMDTLSGKHLRVLMLEYPPFLFINYDSLGNKVYSGICWELILTVSAALNFTFTLDQSKDGKWGNKDPVKSWFGIQGEVFRGEADLGMPITITPERTPVFDFSFSFWQEPCGTVVRLESDDSPDLWFLRPLSQPVWLSLILAYIVTSFFLWLLPNLSDKMRRNKKTWQVSDAFWFTFGAVINQSMFLRKNRIWRYIAFSWCLLEVILINGVYVGNLVAFLATTEYKPPFNTMKEMAGQTDYVYGTEKGIFIEKLFEDAKTGVYEDIGKYIMSNNDSFATTTTTGIERAMSSKYAFMGEYSVLDASIVNFCNITLMKEQFYMGRWAFEMKKGWKYKDELDGAVMKIVESGMIEKWQKTHWPTSECRGQGTFAEVSKVNLQGLISVFSILIGGLCCAGIVLFVESVRASCKGTN